MLGEGRGGRGGRGDLLTKRKWSWKRGGNVGSGPTFPDPISSQLKQQRRRRVRKRHLKSEFALPQTLSRLFHLVSFVKYWSWVLKDYIKVQVKKGQFPSSTNRKIRHFTSYSRSDGKEMYKKRDTPAKLLFCKSKPIAFCRSRCRWRRRRH